ncbi:hypothetical protein L3Q82_024375, partial [Scortum barcoo]
MPAEVQKRLENVAGLMKMDWPLFSEHLIHHVESVRKDKQREDDANKLMSNKLTQLQLSELSSKRKKEKAKAQAPVVTAEQPRAQSKVEATPQLPVTQPTQQPQLQAPAPQPTEQSGTTSATLPPTIHVHVEHSEPRPYANRPRGQTGWTQERPISSSSMEWTPSTTRRPFPIHASPECKSKRQKCMLADVANKTKAAAEDREAEIQPQLQKVKPGDWVYVKVFKRKWDQPRREGPFKVTLTTPTALQSASGFESSQGVPIPPNLPLPLPAPQGVRIRPRDPACPMVTTCARITVLCSGSSAFYSAAAYCPCSARRRLTLPHVKSEIYLDRIMYVSVTPSTRNGHRLLLTVVRHGLSACHRDLGRKVVSRRVRDQRPKESSQIGGKPLLCRPARILQTHQTLLPHQTHQAFQAHLALRLKMAGVYDVLCPIAMISGWRSQVDT